MFASIPAAGGGGAAEMGYCQLSMLMDKNVECFRHHCVCVCVWRGGGRIIPTHTVPDYCRTMQTTAPITIVCGGGGEVAGQLSIWTPICKNSLRNVHPHTSIEPTNIIHYWKGGI